MAATIPPPTDPDQLAYWLHAKRAQWTAAVSDADELLRRRQEGGAW